MKEVKSLSGLAGPNASLKDAGGGGGVIVTVPLADARLIGGGVYNFQAGVRMKEGGLTGLTATSGSIASITLSSPYDFSAVTVGTTIYENASGVAAKPDGVRVFWTDDSNNRVYQADLNVAWDTSAGKVDAGEFNPTAQTSNLGRINFSHDGLNMYLSSYSGESTYIFQYILSTAWDITTATYYGSYSFPQNPSFFIPKEDGLSAFIRSYSTASNVTEVAMTTPNDVTTVDVTPLQEWIPQGTAGISSFFISEEERVFVIPRGANLTEGYSLDGIVINGKTYVSKGLV